mmetsp:Transcript_31387/g.91634  ORF Transcript_31387/g.91634 Transcript_31387/m.91634 type:complete len:462 (+) Transcript_31387:109-1494(+)
MSSESPQRTPREKGDEVKLMFQLFDNDHDGKVTIAELKRVLQSLDSTMWTDERVDKVLSAYDQSGDGNLQFVEFWSWVCGHGGKSVDDFKPALMDQAVEMDRVRRRIAEERADAARKRREEREAKEAANAKKQQEREGGLRKARNDFIAEQMSVGVSEEVARSLFQTADADHDGDVDLQERQWLANETSATTQQIRSLYQKGAGEVDAQGNLGVRDITGAGMRAIVEAFSSWDKDGSGTISFDELTRVLKTLNPKLGEKTAEALRREIDVNQDGLIDILEFVGWLSGANSKKKKSSKKAQEEQEAMVALALHRKRAEEARKQDKQVEFETAQHEALSRWIQRKGIAASCNTVLPGPGAKQICTKCYNRHTWVCHGCGFVSFFDDCVNGCDPRIVGWTCINGKCPKKKCGCKKKPDFWRKGGCTSDIGRLSLDVDHIIRSSGCCPREDRLDNQDAEVADSKG